MENIIELISKTISHTPFEHKTYIAGGFVRDKMMGKKSDDLDIVVDLAEGGIKLANFLFRKKISSKPVIYFRFGTAMSHIGNDKIEFVMTRSESYNDRSRKPDVKNGSLWDDVMRRDFTINSLLMDISTNEILDLSGKGVRDIKNKVIRTTGNPQIIFGEDPLRLLRAVRFAVQLGFSIEKNTLKAIWTNCKTLQKISWERKRDELNKILVSAAPERGIVMLVESGLMKYIIPEFNEILGVRQNKYHDKDVFGHTLDVLKKCPANLCLRLAALLHDIGKGRTKTVTETGVHFYGHEEESTAMASKILKRLKYSNRDIKKICFIISNHMRVKGFGHLSEKISDKAVRKLIFDANENLDSLLEFIHADNLSHAKKYSMPNQIPELKKRIAEVKSELTEERSPVSGNDIMKHFEIKEGELVGQLKKKAEEIWLAHPNWNTAKILGKLEHSDPKNNA